MFCYKTAAYPVFPITCTVTRLQRGHSFRLHVLSTFSCFCSSWGVEIGDTSMLAPLPPSIRAGWAGEVASWVLPCPPSLPTRRPGWETRDNPYIDNSPYVPSSMIPELYIPSDNSIFQSALMDSPLIPSFSPSTG
jgi:hypothetical protein